MHILRFVPPCSTSAHVRLWRAGLLLLFFPSLLPLSVSARSSANYTVITGTAAWAGGFGYFNVRLTPHANAPIVARLLPGEHVRVKWSSQGDAIDGETLWYRVVAGNHNGYVLASAIGFLTVPTTWTGVVNGNAESGITFVYSLSAPHAGAPSDGSFASGARMTVTGAVHGAALESGNDQWYRVVTGAYRPAYIYSAYLKFAHGGGGPIPQPVLTAQAALAVDLDSWHALYSSNATVSRPPASLVKMMTAAVALDHLTINQPITVPAGAPGVGVEAGGTAMGLLPGERLSLHDLLFGMLLPSGNDAAYTLAQAVSGTQAAFAAKMNAKALAIGLKNTHFVQSYGLDSPGQHTTAWDLARLARYDLTHYPLFRTIVGTAKHNIGRGLTHPAFELHNTNRLLGVYPGAFGVKTGTTPGAGQNLVAAVRRGGHRVLVVLLGCSDRYADATALLNYAIARDR